MADPPCLFCEIVAGRAESSIVYEDAATVAFMDLRQLNPGHVLIVPRRHIVDVFGLDDATGAALISAIAIVARGVRHAFEPEGINISASNGAAAGQEVFHLHFHVLPRKQGDGLLRVYPASPPDPPRAMLDGMAADIRGAIGGSAD